MEQTAILTAPTTLALADRVRGTWTSTRDQLLALERRVGDLERRTRAEVEAIPAQLKGAWVRAAGSVRRSLDVPGGDELRELAARVDELAKKVEQLAAQERAPKAAAKVTRLPGRK